MALEIFYKLKVCLFCFELTNCMSVTNQLMHFLLKLSAKCQYKNVYFVNLLNEFSDQFFYTSAYIKIFMMILFTRV